MQSADIGLSKRLFLRVQVPLGGPFRFRIVMQLAVISGPEPESLWVRLPPIRPISISWKSEPNWQGRRLESVSGETHMWVRVPPLPPFWRVVREVYRGGLENRWRSDPSRGPNPLPSASLRMVAGIGKRDRLETDRGETLTQGRNLHHPPFRRVGTVPDCASLVRRKHRGLESLTRLHRFNALVVQWQDASLPSWSCGFDSRQVLQASICP